MGTKYSSNSATGYNSTPPADDGSVTEANKVKYATIKDKLAQPVKDLVDTINTELVTHFDNGPVVYTTNQTINATHYNKIVEVSGTGVTLTLADAATLGAGWYCWITNTDASNTVTIARTTGTDTFDGSATNFSLLANTEVFVFVKGDGSGFIPLHTGPKKSEIALLASANTFTAAQTIALATAGTNLTLSTTDAGATGVTEIINHDSASPAASDVLYQLLVKGRDSAANVQDYGAIKFEIVGATSGSEQSRIRFQVYDAGAANEVVIERGRIDNLIESPLRWGSHGSYKVRLWGNASGNSGFSANYLQNAATQDSASFPSYLVLANPTTDAFTVSRSPAGSTTFTDVFKVDGTGLVTITGGMSSVASSLVTLSSSSIDIPVPAGAKSIKIVVSGASHNGAGTSVFYFRLGTASSVESTGYVSNSARLAASPAYGNSTNEFIIDSSVPNTGLVSGEISLHNITGNQWVASYQFKGEANVMFIGGGDKTLSGALTRVTLFTNSGTFDAGTAIAFSP